MNFIFEWQNTIFYERVQWVNKILFLPWENKIHIFKLPCNVLFIICRASDISRKKKQNFTGFSGANSRKYRPISRGKSQNSRKNRTISRDFRGRKVKIRRKIGRFRGILAEKSQISKDFQGQILRKIGRFHGKFRGKLR